MGRRVLVTGIGTFWGGRVAEALERDPGVDVIVGLGARAPSVELERTEYVKADESYSILSRIVRATGVDTVVHTFLVVDSSQVSSRQMHETNVIGTMNLFAAASQPESRVRNVVVKSSTLVYGSNHADPAWFSEDSRRSARPRHRVERSLLEVEGYVRDYAADNPGVTVSLLRFSNVLGRDIVTPLTKALEAPLVPCVFGYDPRVQFVHERDVVRAITFVLDHDAGGTYNVAGDGVLPWSEVASICGKRLLPLPPAGRIALSGLLRRVGVELPPEVLDLLTYGRGADNRRLVRAGFDYEFTSAGAVHAFAEASRLRQTVGERPPYRYERDVENFFRHSPAVLRPPPA
jgi:UDP-glucose 4-epimerase